MDEEFDRRLLQDTRTGNVVEDYDDLAKNDEDDDFFFQDRVGRDELLLPPEENKQSPR